MIKTRLKYTVSLLIILVLGIPALLITVLSNFDSTFNSKEMGAFACLLLFIGWLTAIVELKAKATVVYFGNKEIRVSGYLGFGKEKNYNLSELSGFQTATISGYNYFYIIKDGLKVGKISNFYHSNYNEIVSFAKSILTDLANKEMPCE